MAAEITTTTVATGLTAFPLLFGVTSIGIGIHSFVSPYNSMRHFGLQAPATGKTSSSQSEAFQKSLIYASGLQDIGIGLSTLGLYAFWQFSPICRVSPLAAAITKKCMGICFMFGTFVEVGDAVIVRQFGNKEYVRGEAEAKAASASINHGITAVLILATGLFLYL